MAHRDAFMTIAAIVVLALGAPTAAGSGGMPDEHNFISCHVINRYALFSTTSYREV
jgi:hypothetical protein